MPVSTFLMKITDVKNYQLSVKVSFNYLLSVVLLLGLFNEVSNFGFKIQIRISYIWYSNLGLKFVHYVDLVKIDNAYNK